MALLQPLIALVGWTFVMWVWMYATRLPAMFRADIDPDTLDATPGASLDQLLPARVSWKAQNYNHLHEAPTLFYAVVLATVVAGDSSAVSIWLAWTYVGLRVIHSLVQATTALVPLRFVIFNASQLVLLALTVAAALTIFAI